MSNITVALEAEELEAIADVIRVYSYQGYQDILAKLSRALDES